jgi:hypothetical protein
VVLPGFAFLVLKSLKGNYNLILYENFDWMTQNVGLLYKLKISILHLAGFMLEDLCECLEVLGLVFFLCELILSGVASGFFSL